MSQSSRAHSSQIEENYSIYWLTTAGPWLWRGRSLGLWAVMDMFKYMSLLAFWDEWGLRWWRLQFNLDKEMDVDFIKRSKILNRLNCYMLRQATSFPQEKDLIHQIISNYFSNDEKLNQHWIIIRNRRVWRRNRQIMRSHKAWNNIRL